MSDKPLLRTRKDVELVEAGESWKSSTGEFTITHEHLDSRFNVPINEDGTPMVAPVPPHPG